MTAPTGTPLALSVEFTAVVTPAEMRRAADKLTDLHQAATPRPWRPDGYAIVTTDDVAIAFGMPDDMALIVTLRPLAAHIVDLLRREADSLEAGTGAVQAAKDIAASILAGQS